MARRTTRWVGGTGSATHTGVGVEVDTLIPAGVLKRGDTYTRVLMTVTIKKTVVGGVLLNAYAFGLLQVHENIPDGPSTVVPSPLADLDTPWYVHRFGHFPAEMITVSTFAVIQLTVDSGSQRIVRDEGTKLVVISEQVDTVDLEYAWTCRLLVKNA